MSRVSHPIDRIGVTFDDPTLAANAGLLLVGTLVVCLELERLVNSMVCLVGRVGGARQGRKVLTMVHAMVAGASHIDHADALRAGNTAGVLPHRVMAPSTLGVELRPTTSQHRPPQPPPSRRALPCHRHPDHRQTHRLAKPPA